MPAPFLTTVTDTLYAPDGTLVSGTMLVVNPATFVSADGFTILEGFAISVPVVDGVFSVNLVPNFGSTPDSTYTVTVRATSQFFDLTWNVPHSVSPINLAAVSVG